jgi:hypothetical protein
MVGGVKHHETTLIPFADMLNHDTGHANIILYDNVGFDWHPAMAYREGEQVFWRYGDNSNGTIRIIM